MIHGSGQEVILIPENQVQMIVFFVTGCEVILSTIGFRVTFRRGGLLAAGADEQAAQVRTVKQLYLGDPPGILHGLRQFIELYLSDSLNFEYAYLSGLRKAEWSISGDNFWW
jgi:hypothetical protein